MTRISSALKALAVAMVASSPLLVAAADTQNLNVTATVTGKCKFTSSVQTFGFGALDPSAAVLTNGAGAAVTYKCTKGTASAGVTAGNGSNFSGGSRRMTNGTDFIPYSLTLSGGTQTGLGFGSGNDLNLTLAGSVAAADYENASAGSYSDTVLLSISP
ncbi:MAG: spore coat protein U domain-containing protein [Ramlibacter sp.]